MNPFDKYNTGASPILFGVEERGLRWEKWDGSYMPTNNHKAIVRMDEREDNERILNVVGSSYKVVHNRDLLTSVEAAMIEQMLPEHIADVQVTDKVSYYGRVCLREYVFPNIKCRIGGGAKSDIGFRLIVQNGYGGSALRIHAGAIEFYCTNGIIRGEYTTTYRKHTSGLVIDNLNTVVSKALLTFAEGAYVWEQWANKPVQHEQAMTLFKELASSKRVAEALTSHYLDELEDRGPNLWAVYSTLTYYASHSKDDFTLSKASDEQDNVAHTMLQRELNVSKWVQSDAWKALATT